MTPYLQQRHFDYVLGPSQDSRLAAVASGSTITGIGLQLDSDAPFVMTGRAVRRQYSTVGLDIDLRGLQTRFTGPTRDYRVSSIRETYIRESLQQAYYGMMGAFKPIVPGIVYPPGSVLMVDLTYTNATYTPIALSFYFRGFKLYPQGAVPAYTYPARMATQAFAYQVPVVSLGADETRRGQIFTVKQDADFALRGGQGPAPIPDSPILAEISLILRDVNKQPYSNDFVPFEILFGNTQPTVTAGSPTYALDQFAVGAAGAVSAYCTGPISPGLFYPEIYIPKNHQMIYDLRRADGVALGATLPASFPFTFLGSKVFER
jgi:hypothetical protein